LKSRVCCVLLSSGQHPLSRPFIHSVLVGCDTLEIRVEFAYR
jgi:hypothetical protein